MWWEGISVKSEQEGMFWKYWNSSPDCVVYTNVYIHVLRLIGLYTKKKINFTTC